MRKEAQFYSEVFPTTNTTLSSEMHSLIVSQFEEAKDLAKKFNLCWLRKKGSFNYYCLHMSKSDRDHYMTFNMFAQKNMFVFTANKGTRFVQKYLKYCCQNTREMTLPKGSATITANFFFLKK